MADDALNNHTVEKIGGTSMSRTPELLDGLLIGRRSGAELYNRVFVVSAYGGITNLLLEHKKTGAPGVYAMFSEADNDYGWSEGLNIAMRAMMEAHRNILTESADLRAADDFVRERIEGARSCLIDLQRLCSYGHFHLDAHMLTIRELLSGLGEAHSAFVTATLLRRHDVNVRFVDLTGWRDESQPDLETRIARGFQDIDLARELPIVTGYAQCREGLMREFDRGYSEVTFSRIAAHTRAREAIVHKEFHLSSADPAVVGMDAVRKLGRTNYDIADQLSNLGMEAIHPRAAKTLRQAGIPLRVTNAFEPDDPGTLIDNEPAEDARVEMVTGLPVFAIEMFEQDMVGVKGYDARILDALTRHKVWIVSKSSNANTITHYVNASLKQVKRVEQELAASCPNGRINVRKAALVSALGRNLHGLGVARRSLEALERAGVRVLALQDLGRGVDVQILVPSDQEQAAIRAMHGELVAAEMAEAPEIRTAA